jgi:predicted HicB family RNase H-like nuclease
MDMEGQWRYNVWTTMTPQPKTEKFMLRVSEEDLAAWRVAAEAQDMALADWIRRACRAALPANPKKK